MNLDQHLTELSRDGITIVPDQLTPGEVTSLRTITLGVRDEFRRRIESGELLPDDGEHKQNYTVSLQHVGIRCMYLWHQMIERLLDHDTVHALAERLMPGYALNDLVANIQQGGKPHRQDGAKRGWHRDYEPRPREHGNAFLWCFFLLDDFTPDNGATFVVPGTHRASVGEGPWWVDRKFHHEDNPFPTQVQAIAPAGSLLVIDSSAIHAPGTNITPNDRVTLNVRLCEPDAANIADHWRVAGDDIRRRASPRVERMMRIDRPDLPGTWPFRP